MLVTFDTLSRAMLNPHALASYKIDITVNDEGKFGVKTRIQSQNKHSRIITNIPLVTIPPMYSNALAARIAGQKLYREWFDNQEEDDIPF